jgi:hypothetical protein
MTENNYIEFKRERDLGAMITDAFRFIRDNWKDYFTSILKIVGPVLLIALVAIIGYFFAISELFSNIEESSTNPLGILKNFAPWFILMILAFVLLNTLLSMTSLFFIKSYINNNGKAKHSEVRSNVLQNFWKFFGYGILVFFSVLGGAIFCYLPGIYLWIALSLGTSIMVFEGRSAGDAYSHSFNLIKGEWWNTFGVILVVGLLIGLLAQAFSVPVMIYQFVKMATISEQDPTQVFNLFKDPIYVVLNLLSYGFQFLLSSISLIVGAFIYFDLNEQKNLTGTLEQIESIGSGYQK